MSYTTLTAEIEEGILTVTLNRPQRMNAVNSMMIEELLTVIDEADADDAVRAVLFTGAGERAFCAGADLSGGPSTFDPGDRERSLTHDRDGGGRVTLRLFDCKKPLIAAVNGAAVGFGATFTLPMDARLASEEARFGFVFSQRGVVPEACSSWFLPRLVGVSQALDWCYSGRVFGAEEALRGGLVNALHPREELIPAARQLAKRWLARSAPLSVTMVRQLMWKMLGADHPMQAHILDSAGMRALGSQPDAHEGVGAFLEKRPPQFSGRISHDLPRFYPFWQTPPFEKR